MSEVRTATSRGEYSEYRVGRRAFIGKTVAAAALVATTRGRGMLDMVAEDNMENVIFPDGADPSAINYRGNVFAAHVVDREVRVLKADSVPELSSAEVVAVWNPSDTDIGAHTDSWAPDLTVGDDGVRLRASTFNGDVNAHQVIYELEADKPDGDYEFAGILNTGEEWAIDGHEFTEAGQPFLVWSHKDARGGPVDQSIAIAPIERPGRLGERSTLFRPGERADTGRFRVAEAPVSYRFTDGPRVIEWSENGGWKRKYHIRRAVFTGDDPMNPGHWDIAERPAFKEANGIYGTGSHCYVEDAMGLYHLYTHKKYWWDGWDRRVRAQRVKLDEYGVPALGEPRPTFGTD